MTKQVIIQCTYNKFINPLTGRCVQLNNKNIQNLLKKGTPIVQGKDFINLQKQKKKLHKD